jgi:hypothetical protein
LATSRSSQTTQGILPNNDISGIDSLVKENQRALAKAGDDTLAAYESDPYRRTAEQYERYKGKNGVVWGSVLLPENVSAKIRIEKPGYFGQKLEIREKGQFAFEPLEPGQYDAIVYETTETPGMRYEKYDVAADAPTKELTIAPGDGTVEVTVSDEKGLPIAGARVTVGKAAGASGSSPQLFTWRRGLTDDNGKFVAPGLTDGLYVVVAGDKEAEASSTCTLDPKGKTAASIVITPSDKKKD